jgi:dTDP-4-amino-4,6-dideoxygalactose transaminase
MLRAVSAHYRLWLIEDCAHGLGGRYKGKLNGTQADAAFFSTQWNKPISTGLGGFAVTAHPEISERLPSIEKRVVTPSHMERLKLGMLIAVRNRMLDPRQYWFALRSYRWASKRGFLPGSSQRGELSAPTMPPKYLKGMSALQAARGCRELCDIDRHVAHRRRTATLYREILTRMGVAPVYEPDDAQHTYLRYPLRVRNLYAFLEASRQQRIEMGDWLLSPIHPVQENLERWGYRRGTHPNAECICGQIVNLPTHSRIDQNAVDRVEQFLATQSDQLVRE